jgi:hypothetical protein
VLQERPADDFLDLLVSLMQGPIKYEVKPVGGPGSPGILFVEGERFNTARFYAPPPAPDIAPGPGDIIAYDAAGRPTIARPIDGQKNYDFKQEPGSKTLFRETAELTRLYARISPDQLAQEAQRGAVMAQARLRDDVLMIKSINDARRGFSELVMGVARAATGKEPGNTPKEWREALAAQRSVFKEKSKDRPRPTIAELAPLAYDPVFGPAGYAVRTLTSTRVHAGT